MTSAFKKKAKRNRPETILSIDTSDKRGSISLFIPATGKKTELVPNMGKVHAETILPSIDCILDKSGLKIEDIDLIAVAIGPGSFTGLRIGIATAKGLAAFSRIPVKGISTLEALSLRNEFKGRTVCPFIDARRSEIYYAIFESDSRGMLKKIHEESCGPVNVFFDLVTGEKNVVLTGDGIDKYESEIKNLFGNNVSLAPKKIRYPNASSIAECAFEKIKTGDGYDKIASVSPFYIRASDAEENEIRPKGK